MPETLRDRRVRHVRSILVPQPAPAALLGVSGDLAGLRVLVLGSNVADTLCALMHTECRHAESRLPGCQTEARSADLVLVPFLTRENVDRVITQAAHALSPHGRIILAMPWQSSDLLSHCALMLIAAGFDLPVLLGAGEPKTLCARRGEHPGRA